MKKTFIILGVVSLAIGGLIWWIIKSTPELPGQKFESEGSDHVGVGTPVDYKTNPPTSGKHYGQSIKNGIYKEPQDDRALAHSLEHGYVIIYYNCQKKISWIREALAHKEESSPSSGVSTTSAIFSDEFRSEQCHQLIDQLISIYEKKGQRKLIVIPRQNMDSRIALTAWTYLEKIDFFDEARIIKFIDAHRDKGPEKTPD